MQSNTTPKKFYSSPDGPYKTLVLVSLTQNISTSTIINSITTFHSPDNFTYNGTPYFDQHSNINYLLISTSNLSNIELLYAIRTADIVIFFIDNTSLQTEISNYKKHLPTYIFCYLNKQDKKMALGYAKKMFASDSVTYFDNLFVKIGSMKMCCSNIRETRPCYVPLKFVKEGKYLYTQGFMRNGFLSRSFMINGSIKCSLVNMLIDEKEFDGDFIDENINIVDFYQNKKENEISESDHDEENNEYSCSESSDNDISNLENEDNLIDKYSSYRGIKNMQTVNFVTNDYPSYYNDVFLFDQIQHLQSKIKKMKSKLNENCLVTAKFEITENNDLNYNYFALFNYYDFEDIKTVYNVEFTCNHNLLTNDSYIIDLGWRFINITPMLSHNSKSKVHKVVPTLQSGIMSFIGPLSFHTSKILIYKDVISPSTLLGTGYNIIYNDRIILEEKIIKGLPHKIDKRYCTVRNMFTTKDEVMYFRNIELKTKNKVSGIIKKPIGTHGVYKAYFSQPIKHGDVIMLSLYKRIFQCDYLNQNNE